MPSSGNLTGSKDRYAACVPRWATKDDIGIDLPPGWTAHVDREHPRVYYIDHVTGLTSWFPPGVPALPSPWERHVSETGSIFYYNRETEKPSWSYPEELRDIEWGWRTGYKHWAGAYRLQKLVDHGEVRKPSSRWLRRRSVLPLGPPGKPHASNFGDRIYRPPVAAVTN